MKGCEACGKPTLNVVIHGTQLWCWPCHEATKGTTGNSAGVIVDSIPGGVEIKHGVCWPDGTPRKFYDKSEIKRVAYENGYFQGGDTPKTNHRLVEARAAAHEKATSQRDR